MSDEAHDAGQEQWGSSAEAWLRAAEEEETGASASATTWMLGAAGLQPGDRVLELACGAGRVGLQAAELVQPDGTVLCSDFSQSMVEAVEKRIGRTGIANAEARVLDAQDLDLEEASFDLVLCRFGYMLMPDPLRALAESRRVLRPGGRSVLAVWGTAEKNPWLGTVTNAVMETLGAPPPQPGTPGPFALGEVGRLRETIEGAGLVDVEVVKIDTEQSYDSLEGWWEQLREVSGPLAALLDALPTDQAEAIKTAAFAAARRYVRSGGEVVFPANVVGASGNRPRA
jgi:enediyne biosynthesis protein CalE5